MAMMRPESRSANMWIWTWICAVYVYFLGPQNLDVCLCFGISKSGDKYCWSIRYSKGPWMWCRWWHLNPDPLICESGPGYVQCVCFVFGTSKGGLMGWSKLKGAVDATAKGPESRSANLWIRIRTWICAMCVCVWGSQIPSQRQDRERSKPGLSKESVAAVALRSFSSFADAALDRQMFCPIRYVSFHILVLSVCHRR